MIQAAELLERIKQTPPPYLLDVREPMELKSAPGVLPGVVNIPLGSLAERFTEVPKDREVVVICRSGARSHQAFLFLQKKGYTQLRNLVGGMMAVQAQKHG